MCGIHGILQFDGQPVAPGTLTAMGNVTTHRGPDDEGQYIDGACGIAMRRLSIIDLAGGHQPLSNVEQTIWLVCNGEIYNYRELRSELQAKGHRFKTGSDCEVLIHLYAEEGDDFVHSLNAHRRESLAVSSGAARFGGYVHAPRKARTQNLRDSSLETQRSGGPVMLSMYVRVPPICGVAQGPRGRIKQGAT